LRRYSLSVGSLVIISALLVCQGCERRTGALSPARRGKVIRMIPWFYMPSENMTVSEENPFPHNAIQVLAREWEKEHPGVEIEFIAAPGDQNAYRSWVFTQCTGETVPELIFWWSPGNDLVMREWVISLDPYLDRPNPYVAGNERWRDLFMPITITPPWQAEDGHVYHLPFDLYLTALFYNMDILRASGVERLPQTWAEFIDAQRRVQQAGYEPFWCPAMWSHWPLVLFGEYLFDEEIFNKLDVLRPDGRIDPEEATRGAYLGITGIHEPRFLEYMRLMKDWARYWKWGFSFSKATESVDLFRTGRLAFRWESALSLTQYLIDPYMTFEFGVTWFPPMTIESSPLASGKVPLVRAAPGNCYYLTQSAERNGLTDLCMDWLMFLTTPEHATMLTQESTGVKVPSAIIGAGADPSLEPLMRFDLTETRQLGIPWAGAFEPLDNFNRFFELYLMDQLTLEEVLVPMKKWYKVGIEQTIRDNQRLPNPADRWDMSRW